MSRYLVVGGAGRTGRRVAQRLQGLGHDVTVASRHPRRDGVRLDLGSVTPDLGLLQGCDGVVIAVEPPSDAAGAEAVLHNGLAVTAAAASRHNVPIVLVSQIYITRPEAYPALEEVIRARGRGEQALRQSGVRYAIVRPGWLHDGPAVGARLTQGDTDDGRTSRDIVAEACVQLVLEGPFAVTFEIFDADDSRDLGSELRTLTLDSAPGPVS